MIKLEEGEQIVAEFKKHWWEIFVWGFCLFILALVPGIFLVAIKLLSSFVFSAQVIYIICFFYAIWLSFLWILFFVEWSDYYLDVWILTNFRLIDIDQKGLFFKDEATIRLEDVRDMKIEYSGVIQSFLKFGTIGVQSSGARTEFEIINVKDPEKIQEMIYNYIDVAKKAKYD